MLLTSLARFDSHSKVHSQRSVTLHLVFALAAALAAAAVALAAALASAATSARFVGLRVQQRRLHSHVRWAAAGHGLACHPCLHPRQRAERLLHVASSLSRRLRDLRCISLHLLRPLANPRSIRRRVPFQSAFAQNARRGR